jgi:hypothetical protein
MTIRISQLLSACLLLMITVAQARDRPNPELKGVTAVTYYGVFASKGRCAVDDNAWNTAIDFVANQSSKLKLVTEAAHREQFDQMAKSTDKVNQTLFKKDAWTDEDVRKSREVQAIERKYLYAPHLSFVIETIEIEGGCAAVIDADVTAILKSSEMIVTGTSVFNPWRRCVAPRRPSASSPASPRPRSPCRRCRPAPARWRHGRRSRPVL